MSWTRSAMVAQLRVAAAAFCPGILDRSDPIPLLLFATTPKLATMRRPSPSDTYCIFPGGRSNNPRAFIQRDPTIKTTCTSSASRTAPSFKHPRRKTAGQHVRVPCARNTDPSARSSHRRARRGLQYLADAVDVHDGPRHLRRSERAHGQALRLDGQDAAEVEVEERHFAAVRPRGLPLSTASRSVCVRAERNHGDVRLGSGHARGRYLGRPARGRRRRR